MKFAVALLALLALGCDPSTPDPEVDAGSDVDAGGDDAGGDAVDAGFDAGPVSLCPPGAPSPDAWDCSTAEPVTDGEAMTGDDLTWTWVGFDNAVCMDGSTTGIGINLNPASSNVLILFEGGGACFDPVSCAGVSNQDGYDETKFGRDTTSVLTNGIFDRTDTNNPVADWNFVYVPYCTGDVHGGTNSSGVGGRFHLGYQNFSWYLTRIIPTFPAVEQVLLAGRSAGGLGTIVNYPQTAEAFGCTPVHVLNDAGGLLTDQYMRPCLQSLVRDAWSLNDVVPEGCEHCTCDDGGGLVNVMPYAAQRYPDRRFAFASAMEDATMRTFYGYGYSPRCDFPQNMPGEDYSAGLLGARELISGHDNFRTFYVPGDQHTFTYQGLGRSSSDGVTIGAWLGQMLSDDAAWTDLGP